MNRIKGTVKWFDPKKGYGFIVPDKDEQRQFEVFVHINAVKRAGLFINEGSRLTFEVKIMKDGRPGAENLKQL